MISVTFDMIGKALYFSALFGGCFGVLYEVVKFLISSVGASLFKKTLTGSSTPHKHGIMTFLLDFVITFSIGLAYLLIIYVSTDGSFVVYPLVFMVMCIFSARKTVRALFMRIKREKT